MTRKIFFFVFIIIFLATFSSFANINSYAQNDDDTINLEYEPHKIAIDKSINVAYVLHLDSISVIDLTTKRVLDVINVVCLQKKDDMCEKPGRRPWNIVIDSSVNRAYVTFPAYNTIAVFDTQMNKIQKTFHYDSGKITVNTELALGADSHQLYVIDGEGSTLSVVDTTKDTFSRNKVKLGYLAHALYVEDKINRAYVATSLYDENPLKNPVNKITVVDTAKKQLLDSSIRIDHPIEMGIDFSTNRAYVTNLNNVVFVINTQTNTIEKTLDLDLPAYFVRVDSLANRAYVMGYNNEKSVFSTIFVINTKTDELIGKIKMEYGIQWMELDPSENRAYLVDSTQPIIHVVTLPFQTLLPIEGVESECKFTFNGQCIDKESDSRIIEERIPACNKFMGIGCDTEPIPMELVCSPKDLLEGKSGAQCTTFVETDEHYFYTKVLPAIAGLVFVILVIVISILLISKFVKSRNKRKIESVLLHNKMVDEYQKNQVLNKNSLSDKNPKKYATPSNNELDYKLKFEKRDIILIFAVLFVMIGLMPFMATIYAVIIAILLYFGVKVFVGRRKKIILEKLGEGICANCGEKITNNKCPTCNKSSNSA